MIWHAQPLHLRRRRAPQIVQSPIADAGGFVERDLQFREAADLADAAGEDKVARPALPDQLQRQRR